MAAQSPDELFDVVDENDRVIGQATRAEVHAKRLLHRAVHIFVLNSAGELLIQKRSAAKDEYPGCWTSSAAGHVDAGEDYDASAARELREELGLSTHLERVAKFGASPETSFEHLVFYRTIADVVTDFCREEIDEVSFRDPTEILADAESTPEKYARGFRTLLTWFVDQLPGNA